MKPDKIWPRDLGATHRNLCAQVKAHPPLSNGQILDVSEETQQSDLAACLEFATACGSWSAPLKKVKQIFESFQDAGTAAVGRSLMRVHWLDTKWLVCWRQWVTQDRTVWDPVSGKGNGSLKGNVGISPDLNAWIWIYFYKNKFRCLQTRQNLC